MSWLVSNYSLQYRKMNIFRKKKTSRKFWERKCSKEEKVHPFSEELKCFIEVPYIYCYIIYSSQVTETM